MGKISQFLEQLNAEYLELHQQYEEYFWISYMGDHSIDDEYQNAQTELEQFKTNKDYAEQIDTYLENMEESSELKLRLEQRKYFFSLNATPEHIKTLKEKVNAYENQVQSDMANWDTGYLDPKTGERISATNSKMRLIFATDPDETVRKAAWEGFQKTATDFVPQLIQLVKRRNEIARAMGYENFYEFKAQTEERMSSNEIYKLFDDTYNQLKHKFEDITELEKDQPGLRKPWNFWYLMAGDFTKEEDQYFPLGEVIKPWAETFTALGINYQGAKMKLDLLERKGKYNNGFCHQPRPTYYDSNGQKITGTTNFTCTAIPGQLGSGSLTGNTLFHEGGHAAHFANMAQKDVILNTEYAPMGVAWAETQSMFCDTIFSSIERKTRYAKNAEWNYYPFELFERKVKKLHKIASRSILSIAAIVKFEQELYTANEEDLTPEWVIGLAKFLSLKYFNYSQSDLWILTVPHIYCWTSSAYYHGYGMAEMALYQFREYFHEKYGYIVDNAEVGKLLTKWRNYWSSLGFKELIQKLINQDFSAQPYIDGLLKSEDEVIETAKQRIEKLKTIPKFSWEIDLNAEIELRDGKTLIASSTEGFDAMCKKFSAFIAK